MSITLESLDDSLIERKQKEIKDLKKEIKDLHSRLSMTEDARMECNKKYDEKCKENNVLTLKNLELSEKLLKYEHEPIKLDISNEEIDVLYWDNDKEEYDIFATFYKNKLEPNIEDFCEEFLLELKDMYMV